MVSLLGKQPHGPETGMWDVGVFILCVNLWRYFHLMGYPILTLWDTVNLSRCFYCPAILTLD
jgi:hypothetical protein